MVLRPAESAGLALGAAGVRTGTSGAVAAAGRNTSDGGIVTVTAVPALHGPDGAAQEAMGDVAGFVLTADDLPAVYVSGDNASMDAVRQTADRFGPVDTAVLFIGSCQGGPRVGGELITINSEMAAGAAKILGVRCGSPRTWTAGSTSWRTGTTSSRPSTRPALRTSCRPDPAHPRGRAPCAVSRPAG